MVTFEVKEHPNQMKLCQPVEFREFQKGLTPAEYVGRQPACHRRNPGCIKQFILSSFPAQIMSSAVLP
jgi:hypothetical protein